MKTLKVKTRSGAIQSLQVEELLEVDGVPFNAATDHADCSERFAYYEGRLHSLERLLVPVEVVKTEDTTLAE